MKIVKWINEKFALNALGAKNYYKAAIYFKKIMDAHPDCAGVHYNYAISLIGLKHYDAAETHLRYEMAHFGENFALLKALGELLFINRKPEAARVYLKKALRCAASDKERKLLENKLGTLDSAESYHAMLRGHQLFEEGTLLMEEQKWQAARDIFLNALECDPYNPLLYNNLGVIFLNHEKKYQEARTLFAKAMEYSDLAILKNNFKKTNYYLEKDIS